MKLYVTFQEGRLEQALAVLKEMHQQFEEQNAKSVFEVRRLGLSIPNPQIKFTILHETNKGVRFDLMSIVDDIPTLPFVGMPGFARKRIHDQARHKIIREITKNFEKAGMKVSVMEVQV